MQHIKVGLFYNWVISSIFIIEVLLLANASLGNAIIDKTLVLKCESHPVSCIQVFCFCLLFQVVLLLIVLHFVKEKGRFNLRNDLLPVMG